MSNGLDKNISGFKKKIKYSRYFNSFYPFISQPEKKFLIYTKGRTGSTVLTDLLNSHPEMFCDYEIFNIENTGTAVRFPMLYINSCSKRAALNKKSVYGFKVKIEQLKNEHKIKNIENFLQNLADKDWKIIYLKRTNILNHTLSGIISNHSKIFHLRNGNDFKHEKFNVDCRHLLDVMNYFDELDSQEEESLKNIPHLNIGYESELLDNSSHQSTADKVFAFIGIESFPVNTNLKKILPENLKEIILNYDEMYKFISDTKFSKFLS